MSLSKNVSIIQIFIWCSLEVRRSEVNPLGNKKKSPVGISRNPPSQKQQDWRQNNYSDMP